MTFTSSAAGRSVAGKSAASIPMTTPFFLTTAAFTSTGGGTSREPSGEEMPNERTGEPGPRFGDLGPDHGPLGQLPVGEDLDLEHLIVRAGREGCPVRVGNAVSVIIVDIGQEDLRSRLALRGIIPFRRRIRTGSGGDRPCDHEGGKDVPGGKDMAFSHYSPSPITKGGTPDVGQKARILASGVSGGTSQPGIRMNRGPP